MSGSHLKVTIVAGGRSHALDLAQELQKAGVLHRLITNYPRFKTRRWDIPGNKVVNLPLGLMVHQTAMKMGGERLVMRSQTIFHGLFSRQAAHYLDGSTIIHGWSGYSEPSIHWAKRFAIPIVLERSSAHMTVQCQILRDEYRNLGLNWNETHPGLVAMELREYALADRIAVPSLFVHRSFLSQGFDVDSLIYNPFGTNTTDFSPKEKQDKVFRIAYAGSLSVQKGIYYLVQAFMQAKIPKSELRLIGGFTAETPRLLQGSNDQVKCLGHVPQQQLAGLYQDSSVFVMPSIQEGMSLVQLQALACGLPLITTHNTGGEDLLRMSGVEGTEMEGGILEFPAGFLVPIRDPSAIAACLTLLAQNRDLYEAKREAAILLRSVGLDWRSYANRAIAAYRSLLK